jgi:rhodanese-related sulfurtransferase
MKRIVTHHMAVQKKVIGYVGFLMLLVANGCAPSMMVSKAPMFEDVSPQEAYELIQAHQTDDNFVILDVRRPEELAETGYLENAINVNYGAETFRTDLETLNKDKTYLIYCRSGGRSGRTLMLMEELQFQHVYNMTGGILQWTQEERPLITDARWAVCCSIP